MISNYQGQEAIDNDDGSAYYNTHHNFLIYSGNGMKNDFGAPRPRRAAPRPARAAPRLAPPAPCRTPDAR